MGLDIDPSRCRGIADGNIAGAGDEREIGAGIGRGAHAQEIMGLAQDVNRAGIDIAAVLTGGQIGQSPGIGPIAAIVESVSGDGEAAERDAAMHRTGIEDEVGGGVDLPIAAGDLLHAEGSEVKRPGDPDIADAVPRTRLQGGIGESAPAEIAGDGVGKQLHRSGDIDIAIGPKRQIGAPDG